MMLYFTVFYGLLGILFGTAILKLKEVIGNIAKITGILGIIVGACFILMGIDIIGIELDLNILSAKYGALLVTPVYLLEIIILFKLAKLKQFK